MEDRDWYRAASQTRRAKSEDAASPAWRAFEGRRYSSRNKGSVRLHFGPLGWIVVVTIIASSFLSEVKPSWLDHSSAYVPKTPRLQQSSYPFPTNGYTKSYFDQALQQTAPLTLQTSPADLNRKSVICVREWKTGALIATVFLEANTIITINLPPGVYRLWIASGHHWQNDTVLFGDATQVERSTAPFSLVNDRGRVVGFNVQLMQTDHPNFPTENVSSVAFGAP